MRSTLWRITNLDNDKLSLVKNGFQVSIVVISPTKQVPLTHVLSLEKQSALQNLMCGYLRKHLFYAGNSTVVYEIAGFEVQFIAYWKNGCILQYSETVGVLSYVYTFMVSDEEIQDLIRKLS